PPGLSPPLLRLSRPDARLAASTARGLRAAALRRRRAPPAAHLRGRAGRRERRDLAVAVGELLLPAATLLHAAPDRPVALGDLLGDEAGVALGARRGDRLVPGDELACRIARAAVEGLPAAGPALEHLALAAAAAGDPGRDGPVKRLPRPAPRIPSS